MRESGPSPNHSPEGKGRDHRDTPIMRVYASFYPLISSLIGVTSYTTPLPRRKGRNYRDTPVERVYASFYPFIISVLVCHTIFLKNLLFLVYAITKEGKVGF